MEQFKDRFNQALVLSGKTRAQLSRETGISEPLLHFYSTGRHEPKTTNIGLIAKALHVSEDWLITGREEKSQTILVEAYNRLSDSRKQELLRYARYLEYEDRLNGTQK